MIVIGSENTDKASVHVTHPADLNIQLQAKFSLERLANLILAWLCRLLSPLRVLKIPKDTKKSRERFLSITMSLVA